MHRTLVCEEFGATGCRLTKDTYDLTTKKGIEDAANLVNSFPANAIVHLFGSVPCTPWCSWHYINEAKHPHLKPILAIARRRSLVMINNFCLLAKLVLARGAQCTVSFEWPKSASGWRHKSVIAMHASIGLAHTARVDGCSVGVKELKTDRPIPKPWTVKSTSPIVAEHLNTLRCPGESDAHQHGVCQGSDTLRTVFTTKPLPLRS